MSKLPWVPKKPEEVDEYNDDKKPEDRIGPPIYIPRIPVPQPGERRVPYNEPPQPSASPKRVATGWQF